MTDKSFVSLTFSCKNCGGELETKDDVRTDDSMVTCKACGAEFMTYGKLVAHGKRLLHAEGRKIFRKEVAKVKKNLGRRRGAIKLKVR